MSEKLKETFVRAQADVDVSRMQDSIVDRLKNKDVEQIASRKTKSKFDHTRREKLGNNGHTYEWK